MSYPTAYQFEIEYLQDRYDELKKRFLSHTPNGDFNENIIALTAKMVRSAKHNYLRFGPYWDGVRNILFAKTGYPDFTEMEKGSLLPMWYDVKDEKGETDPYLTIVAAWEFMDFYNRNFFQGNADFQLWEDDPERYWNATDCYWEMLFDIGELPRD